MGEINAILDNLSGGQIVLLGLFVGLIITGGGVVVSQFLDRFKKRK